MNVDSPTFVGQVASVTGSVVRVRLRSDTPSLVFVEGSSYRIGQIGAFFRIPLGYAQLYGICTQVGADAAPLRANQPLDPGVEPTTESELQGVDWMTINLFGESLGNYFERGIGQYPTVGDEVHLVTERDLGVIYGPDALDGTVEIGSIAASSGIPAQLTVASLVSRHSAVVGSTGAGKSNLVTVLVEGLAGDRFPTARILVIDPHGEYASAFEGRSKVFSLAPPSGSTDQPLVVPFWALPFAELMHLTLGPMQPATESSIRDIVTDMKVQAASNLADPPPNEAIAADSPIPFNIRKLWFDLDEFERQTFSVSNNQNETNLLPFDVDGDPLTLQPRQYPTASPYNQAPYRNQRRRQIERQLDLFRSRLQDSRFQFLFNPGLGYAPDLTGNVETDLDTLVGDWVGHDKPITVLDVSGLPSEVLSTIVGTVLRIVYDALFWALDLPVGGRRQPLLVVLEEAHLFLSEGNPTAAHRTLGNIAKEGRKYGVGLVLVTQRPSDLDSAVLSQCGTMVSLRLTNGLDRRSVSASLPDDLGALTELLPALRTGEALVVGDAVPVPSRVRVRLAAQKPVGADPLLPGAWSSSERPDPASYAKAIATWRRGASEVADSEEE